MTTFDVLAEPNRRTLLGSLLDGEHSVGALAERTSLTQPSVSKHLRVLRDAGLVSVRHDAQRRIYRLRLEPLLEINEWLAPFIAVWSQRLDALESHLDTLPD